MSFAPSAASQQSQEAADAQPRLMDNSWINIQKKTFTNWINSKLKQKNVANIAKIETDLCNGEKLIQLLEIIGDESLGRYTKNPRMRLQSIENMNTALAFIKKRGVPLTNIGAEDLVDGNEKLILGLIWSIILRFSIADISQDGLTAKEGLLLWVQKRTAPYSADFFVRDFTMSWQSGLPFCALIHRHRPDLLDYWALNKENKHENTALAFDIAERELGIAKLFNVEDIVDVAKPDERSVMTYVAQYFHAFSEMDKVGNAGRRVGQFGAVMAQAWAMQNDYEKRVRKLIQDVSQIQAVWKQSTFVDYPQAKKQLIEFDTYKNTIKRRWVVEKRDLDTLLGNIQTKLKTYSLPAYVPPAGLTPEDLESNWAGQIKAEGQRKRDITGFIREIKDVLKSKFANAANKAQSDINDISISLSKLNGELEQQLSAVQSLEKKLAPLKASLSIIEKINKDCIEANIEDNEHTIYSVEDLEFELGIVSHSISKTAAFIKNQIVARTVSNITPQQLESYSETFRHFDKENQNNLTKEQFKAALQAEGISCSEQELEKLFKNGTSLLSFEKFIDFMRSVEEDKTSPDQLQLSFTQLAGDKEFITEADMVMGGLAPQVIEYFKMVMPKKGSGYDYKPYVNNCFGV